MNEWDDAYLVAVADSLAFALSPTSWTRLAAYDSGLQRSALTEPLAALAQAGVQVSFGDGSLPGLEGADPIAIGRLREAVRRMRELAPHALGDPPLAVDRFLCTDPWPRIYGSAVLEHRPATPVHVVQESDTATDVDRWQRLERLHTLSDLRVLILFGAPGSLGALDLEKFGALTILDLEGSRLSSLPPSIVRAARLEVLYLGRNSLSIDALGGLRALPRLRYVGLRDSGIDARAAGSLRALLPPGCTFDV